MVAQVVAAFVGIFVVLAELAHFRRCQRLAPLVFGPYRQPGPAIYVAPLLRTAACTALAWGLVTLLTIPPRSFRPEGTVQPGKEQHLLLVLDVSPSMRLVDAGPSGKQSRKERARDVMRSLFERIPAEQSLVSVIAVYNGAKPVVAASKDLDVVDNILGDIPLFQAFEPGQTRLLDGLEEAAQLAKPWNPRSATLIMLSDGDTVPGQGMPALPASINQVLVVGFGDAAQGSFIDGRQSRQDVFTLRQIATRLKGVYHDGNQHHLPSTLISEIVAQGLKNQQQPWSLREYALLAVGCGGFVLALLPFLLEQFGRSYLPGVRHREAEERVSRRQNRSQENRPREKLSAVS